MSPPDLKVNPVLQRTHQPLVVVLDDKMEAACRKVGARHVVVGSQFNLLNSDGTVRHEVDFFGDFIILIPEGGEDHRDTIAINLGDERCRWAYWPVDEDALALAIDAARPMWTDEVSTIDDVPEPVAAVSYKSGFDRLDEHGFRIVLPAFMPIIGPYGSGKSVFLRQLLVNLWKQHQWKFLLTSFEEKVKPRYLRDLRRHIIGRPINIWTDADVARADGEIRQCAVFLRRKRSATLDLPRLLNRIEFAVRVHGVRVVAIDPVNEIDHQVPRGESKTDYMGKFIMALKALADDYGLLMICAAHPPKDGVEKRLSKNHVLTLNDGADTAHWGNKADIGLCLWRNLEGPTFLHGDKLKDEETMGKKFLCEMHLDPSSNSFRIGRMGYDIIANSSEGP